MAEGNPRYRLVETSFCEEEKDGEGFVDVVIDQPLETKPGRKEQAIDATVNDVPRLGLITRLGRGVKSAVGGAINFGKNIVNVGKF